MINLDKYKDKTIDFMLDGELVKVNEPSFTLVNEIVNIGKSNEEEVVNNIITLVTKILNNNCSSRKFTEKQVSSYPKSLVQTVLNVISTEINKVDNDPN